jgi:translocation and assembly module TamB
LNFEDSTGSGVVNYSGRITAASDVRKYFPGSLTESLPYQGSASFTKGGAALNVQKGVVTTPGSRIDYSGSVTLAGAYDLRVKLHSANTDELIRAAGLFDAEARRQLEQRAVRSGAAFDFEGTLSGVKSQYRLAGNVISPFLQVKRVRLSNISAALELTPRFVHLENASVQFGRSRITGSIRYPFITRGERIQVDATVQNAQLEDLLALANSRLPLGGLVNARIQVSGPDLQHMDGKAPLVVDHPTFFGEPFDRLTADLIFRESVYEVQNFRLVKGRGLVTGTIAGNVDGSSFNVDLSGRDILLTSIRGGNLQGYQLGGVLNFTIRGNGTLQNLNHTLHAEVRAFTVQGEHLQNLVVDAKAEGKRVDFTAVTNYLNNRLEARGHVLVTDDYPFQATMDLRNAPIRPYMALFGQRPKADLSGLATGRVQASGKLKRLEDASIEARLSSLQLAVNRYQLRNQGEVVLRFEQGVLDIKPVKMVGPDTSLTLSGQVSTLGTQPVSLRISGNANLLVLSAFVPDLNARGNVSLNVYASGSMRQLRILGSANFNKVYLAQPGWPTPLFDTSGSLRFTANQVSIESITAKTRYGTLHIEGGLFLEGLVPSRGRLNITGEGLRIEYPQDVKSTVDIDVDFLKSSTNQLLSGAIYIRNSEYIKNITLADLVLQISNFRALPPARAYGRQEINLDLDVEAYKSIRIKNSLADVLASGLFNVRGTIDEPVILGRMNVDQGKLVLQDSKYQISRGSITFNNPRKTTPVLDFEAETSVRDYTVTINLRGPLDHLTTTFRSDPPLTTSDIVSMLAIGRPIQEVARDSRNREQQSQTLAFHGATTLLSRSLTDKLTARSTRLFGFDRFTIDPFLFTGQNPSARVTLGKQISKDVAVIFATDLSSTQSEVVTIEYTIREGITLVATRTESGAFGLDVKLRKRF